ncbi:MAG: endonuclease/exonuclease/phosphatase family protein [Patescibacteria group bacterium]
MKLLQWNVWYKEDVNNIVTFLKEINPDIICLQELTINHPEFNQGVDTSKYIANELGFNYYFKDAQTSTNNGKEYTLGNGIFSRFPILQSRFHYIQEPSNPNDQNTDYSAEGRLYVEVELDTPNGEYTIGTVHMSYTDRFVSTPAKEAETRELIKVVQEKEKQYLLTGDFNALPESYTITELQKYLKNVGPEVEAKTWTTKPFSYNGFEATTLDWRLDYGFMTPDIQVRSAEILNTEYSDHLPLLIEF